ncbi:hypothetical protein BDV96DRAFT_643396 [Lophiotrema nucula]|uniref:Uncharacterized protein n=1 Tax=Lophiotrema nucula TaxID=690887 RepID=A0A6A5ZGA1_9PLEO|nr:hypothetical protein BDV96DRAFT_643396 [Lophiotrema nucula]
MSKPGLKARPNPSRASLLLSLRSFGVGATGTLHPKLPPIFALQGRAHAKSPHESLVHLLDHLLVHIKYVEVPVLNLLHQSTKLRSSANESQQSNVDNEVESLLILRSDLPRMFPARNPDLNPEEAPPPSALSRQITFSYLDQQK